AATRSRRGRLRPSWSGLGTHRSIIPDSPRRMAESDRTARLSPEVVSLRSRQVVRVRADVRTRTRLGLHTRRLTSSCGAQPSKTVTLLYSARDSEHNNAIVLQRLSERRLRRPRRMATPPRQQ